MATTIQMAAMHRNGNHHRIRVQTAGHPALDHRIRVRMAGYQAPGHRILMEVLVHQTLIRILLVMGQARDLLIRMDQTGTDQRTLQTLLNVSLMRFKPIRKRIIETGFPLCFFSLGHWCYCFSEKYTCLLALMG